MSSQRVRMLLIEDGKIDQILFKKFVEKNALPYDYVVAERVTDARNLLKSEKFQVVVADYFLEDGTADELFDLVTSAPLVVVTSAQDRDIALNAMKAGAFDYLVKDTELSHLNALPVVIDKAIKNFSAQQTVRMLSQAIMSTRDGVVVDDSNHRIIFVNRALCSVLGYTEDELLGAPITVLASERDQTSLLKRIESRTVLEWSGETVCRKKDGQDIPIFLSAAPLRSDRGDEISLVLVLHDITEIKRAETERIRLEEQLRQAQKLEAIGVLAGGVAHDFNNILASIIGFSEMAIEDSPDNNSARSSMNEVLRAANRAKDLVEQILAFSRTEGPVRSPVNIRSMCEEVLKLIRPTISKSIEIELSYPKEAVFVMAPPTKLHQVVLNLCTNASQAIGEREGTIFLKVEILKPEESPIDLGAVPGSTCGLRLSVRDNGRGMPADVAEKIFEPFYTTKPSGKGTGLGLYASQKIVRELGGTISVTSEVEGGSEFTVFLPGTTTAGTQEEKNEGYVQGRGRILFVDDEETIARMGKQMLERLGYTVSTCPSGIEALELLQSDPHSFDLVIMDQKMPRMTGDVLGRKILELRDDLPLILCSGYSENISEEKAKQLGFKDYLAKPLSFSLLSRRVGAVLEEARAARNPA